MAYKDKPFRKPRQTGANVEDRQKTGHRKDNSRREKKRGRCLNHIIYEDGDSEDMDEMEYEDAWFLYIKSQNVEANYPRREETD
jgi:hypothetical protein